MATRGEVKIGDKIRVVKTDTYTGGEYAVGDVLTVESFYDDVGINAKELTDGPYLFFREFEVIGQEEQAEQEPPKPEVGDLIVFNEAYPCITARKHYEVTEVDLDGDTYVRDNDGFPYLVSEDEDFTLFKRVTPPAPKKPAYEPKVGDIVELTTDKPRYGFGSAEQGDIGVIASVTEGRANVRFPRHKHFPALPEELTLLAKAENREVIGGE